LKPIPPPEQRSVQPALARQTIDILGMLEQKTKGNLEDDERRLLTHMLYELRYCISRQKKNRAESLRNLSLNLARSKNFTT
jgi:hypothetical protein